MTGDTAANSIAAATVAGATEIMVFHPFDTTAKRLMSNEKRVVEKSLMHTLGNAGMQKLTKMSFCIWNRPCMHHQ